MESKDEKYWNFIETLKKQCYNISSKNLVLLADIYSNPQEWTAMSSYRNEAEALTCKKEKMNIS